MIRIPTLFALTLAACGTPEVEIEPEEIAPGPVVVNTPEQDLPDEPTMIDGVMFVEDFTQGPVTSPVTVTMMVHGKTVHPAGEVIEGSGHHHIIIDGEPVPAGTVVPSDTQHIHFGAGQTATEVELTPGEHTLTLQFANGMHESYGPEWSKTVTVNVAPPAE